MRGRTLPTKMPMPLIGAIGLAVAILGIAAYLVLPNKQSTVPTVPDPSLASAREIARTDADGDGLLDWEETLIGTDPAKVDSDGDGTSDGDEVIAKRNPLIPGPSDLVSDASVEAFARNAGTETKAPGTLTDQAAKDLFGTYMAYKQSGTMDKEHQAQLVATLVDSAKKEVFTVKYGPTDLSIIKDDSDADRRAYYAKIQGILKNAYESNDNSEPELVTIGRAIDSGNPEDMRKVELMVAMYKKLSSDLAAIRVPASAAQVHLNFLNVTYSFATTLDGLRTLRADPLLATIVVANYKTVEKQFLAATTDFGAYFKTNKII